MHVHIFFISRHLAQVSLVACINPQYPTVFLVKMKDEFTPSYMFTADKMMWIPKKKKTLYIWLINEIIYFDIFLNERKA